MSVIRLILAAGFLVLFLVLSMPYAFILWLVGKKDPAKSLKASYRLVSWGFGVIWKITGSKTTVEGIEKIPLDRAVVFTANHRSIFDIVLLVSLIPVPTGVIAKKSMKKAPLLNIWMNMLHCKYLDRNDIREGLQVILSAIEEVKNGVSILIFPEGTRNKTDEPILDFHAGSFKAATKPGAPVIPVTLTGTRDVFETHMPFLKPSVVTVTFGDPVETGELDRNGIKELPDRVRDEIRETYIRKTGKE
ncbi:MAG: 1-acyl-sn-glycerol-3-phosphate acyltransferase [Lachnospiraceae bacterium]|nr:1-acyl-sn-glycerol-3-phosphate acyltransferase [Lachnospiraceae bacterium]